MTSITEILLGAGEIQRRYLIGEDRHTPEILAEWTPLVDRLLDHPSGRLYHGLAGLPYWEASLSLPERLDHPELSGYLWLSFYADPEAETPYYVGLCTPSGRAYDETRDGVAMLLALGGGIPDGPTLPAITREITETAPNLAGSYLPGVLMALTDPAGAAKATGECAAILAQILLSRWMQ